MSCQWCGLAYWNDISGHDFCPNCGLNTKGENLYEDEAAIKGDSQP